MDFLKEIHSVITEAIEIKKIDMSEVSRIFLERTRKAGVSFDNIKDIHDLTLGDMAVLFDILGLDGTITRESEGDGDWWRLSLRLFENCSVQEHLWTCYEKSQKIQSFVDAGNLRLKKNEEGVINKHIDGKYLELIAKIEHHKKIQTPLSLDQKFVDSVHTDLRIIKSLLRHIHDISTANTVELANPFEE